MLIAIEGIDGSGKGTQCELLKKWLKKEGYDVVVTAEPTRGYVGQLIRKILRNDLDVDPKSLALLFTADRFEHQVKVLEKLKDQIVITDRYSLSTYAYQAAQGVPVSYLEKIHAGIMKPDLQILLDVKPENAVKRLRTNHKFEKPDFLKRVRRKYLELADEDTYVVSSEKKVQDTFKDIQKIVRNYLKRRYQSKK
ncbi:MAG: dTMP kinase [archaeon]